MAERRDVAKPRRPGRLVAWLARIPKWVLVLPLVFLLTLALALWLFNPRLTAYLEGPSFKAELDKQTSKGLHFTGEYSSIKRTGFATGASPHFEARDGVKAFKSVVADDITGEFNPFGIFLRRWQLQYIRIRSGRAEIQVYEPKPDHKPPKPWYAIFTPDRVYLKQVTCDSTDIIWHMRKKEAGFYGTRLLITPYGRDFEYHATGGKLSMPFIPDLALRDLHMVITKEWITLHEIHLTEGEKGTLSARGKAGLKSDKSIQLDATFADLPIGVWLPKSGNEEVRGSASGEMEMQSSDETIETSSGHGSVQLSQARVGGLPFLDYVASATRNKSIEQLELSQCSLSFQWKYPRLDFRDIKIEAEGEFRLEGRVAVDAGKIDGQVDLGVSERNIAWLPKAREQIFTRQQGGYYWTKVRLGGTLKEPTNDLLPRLTETLKASPDVSAGLFFRQLGEWFEQKFKGN